MYKISINYQTGDSFKSEDRTQLIEYSWKNLDIAKENLQRIKEHYQWAFEERCVSKYTPKNKFKKPIWLKDDKSSEYCVVFKLDDGKETQYHCFWIGYFERLHSAEIVLDQDDMKIVF